MELISWAPAETRPVGGPDTHDALVSRIANGDGWHVMSLLTLKAGARMGELKSTSTQCVTIILGTAWLATATERYRLPIGKGFLVKAGEQYYLGSVDGALAVVVESQTLEVHADCRMSEADVQALRQ